jgi:hypothetical protein
MASGWGMMTLLTVDDTWCTTLTHALAAGHVYVSLPGKPPSPGGADTSAGNGVFLGVHRRACQGYSFQQG